MRVGFSCRLGCGSVWHGAPVVRSFHLALIDLVPLASPSAPPLVKTSPRGSCWTVALLRFGAEIRFFLRRLRGFLGGNGMSSRIATMRKRDCRANASKAVTARQSHRPSCPSSSATRTIAASIFSLQSWSVNGSKAHLAGGRCRLVFGSTPRSTSNKSPTFLSCPSWRDTFAIPMPSVIPRSSREA